MKTFSVGHTMSQIFRGVFVGFLAANAARAHDFWIEPSNFRPAPEEVLKIGLRVGMSFKGDAVPRNPEKIDRFEIMNSAGVKPVAGMDGVDPAGSVKVESAGLHVIGYRSKRSFIELEAAEFEAYLKEEGLGRIIALRKERGESDKKGTEAYSRSAKAVVQVGEGGTGGFDKPMGFTFEIIPQKNPLALRPQQDELPLILLFDGKPAAGMEVFAMHKVSPESAIQAQTDAAGRVSFRLTKPGVWMIKSIHMAPAAAELKVDWESVWATLVFEIPAAAKP